MKIKEKLANIGLNEKSINKLYKYFNIINDESIITFNDILRNLNQKLLIDDLIKLLVQEEILVEYDSDYFDEDNEIEPTFKIYKFDYFNIEEIEKQKIKFSQSIDILNTLKKIQNNYNIDNQNEIDLIINEFNIKISKVLKK
jgi:hypothetical protein